MNFKLSLKIFPCILAGILGICYHSVFADDGFVYTETDKKAAVNAEADVLLNGIIGHSARGATRAGFVSDIVELAAPFSAEEVTVPDFQDVSVKEDYAPYIHGAVSMGYISPGETFRPNENITFYEALKIIGCALNYERYAELKGGWPMGYLEAAQYAGILEGVKINDEYLTEDDALMLIFNMLNAHPLESGNKQLSVSYDSLLKQRYNVSSVNGILYETPEGNLMSAEINKQSNTIKIGENRFNIDADKSYDEFLGYNVNAYYDEDDNLVAIAATEKNVTAQFDMDNASMRSDTELVYEGDTKNKNLKLDSSYNILYNDFAAQKKLSDYIGNCEGRLVLIDSNNDGKYDTVKICAVSYLVVKNVSRSTRIIYDENSPQNSVDLSDENGIYIINGVRGREKFLDVKADSVYEIYASENRKKIEANLLEKKLAGTVRGVSENKITIEDAEYETTPYFEAYYRTGFKAGDEGTFTVASNGKIVNVSKTDTAYLYGYMASLIRDTNEDKIYAKIFDEEGNFNYLTFAKKVTLDGKALSREKAYNSLTASTAFSAQLVRFAKKDGELVMLDTAEEESDTVLGSDKPKNNSLTHFTFASDSFYYKSIANVMYPYFNVSASKVFVIPSDLSNAEGYKVTNYSFFTDLKTYTGLQVYDLQPSGNANVVISRSDSILPDISEMASSFIVDKIVSAYYEPEDKTLSYIYGWQNNKFISYYIDEDISLKKASGETIGFGDIIRYYAEGNIIRKLVCDFDADENVFARNAVSGAATFNTGNMGVNYQIGRAYTLENGYVYMTDGPDGEYKVSSLRNFPVGTNNIAIVNLADKSIVTGSLSDVGTYQTVGEEADIILLRQRQLSTNGCFIYRR